MKQEQWVGLITYFEIVSNSQLNRTYLILHYKRGPWDLPTGKLKEGESMPTAALRMVHESTGLTGQIRPEFKETLSYIFKDHTGELVHKTVTFFVGQSFTQTVSLSEDLLYYKWLPLRDAVATLTHTNMVQVLRAADRFIKSTLGG